MNYLSIVADIEKEFGNTIPEEDILGGKLDIFNNICAEIVRQLPIKKIAI